MRSDRIQEIYNGLQAVTERRKRDAIYTALGYTSNLDLAAEFRAEDLNDLLAKYLPAGVLRAMRPAERIRTMEDLLETVVYYCLQGIGGEVDIEDPDLVRALFPCVNAIGGTGVQAALALDRLGAGSIVHLTDDSKEVLEQLASPNIRMPLADGTLGGASDVQGRGPQETHVILQFRRGSRIVLGEQEEEIPASNRLILTRNTVNHILPLDENFLHWVEAHSQQVSSLVLSSFNSILDPEILRHRLGRILEHVERYRRKNPQGTVYFEDAHYHDRQIRRLCMETVYPHTDIVGMNEEELLHTLDMYQVPVKIEDIFSKSGITHAIHTGSNKEGLELTLKAVKNELNLPSIAYKDYVEKGMPYEMIFTNLVDTDMLYGHRNDAAGYGRAIEEIDTYLPAITEAMTDDDMLIITADHGCDPCVEGTDHTREKVPVLVYTKQEHGKALGTLIGFDNVAKFVKEWIM